MNTKILGLSGKKQSGKNTSANWLIGVFMQQVEIIKGFVIQDNGKLWITDIFGDTTRAGVYDIDSGRNQEFNHQFIYPFVKIYSYADELKQLCINVLGLSYEQCYGTDADKDSLTHLNWENMPGTITKETLEPEWGNMLCDWFPENIDYYGPKGDAREDIIIRLADGLKRINLIYHQPGPMTGREVMQYVGTEIFRKMYGQVWVDATIRKIEADNPTMAIICDVRFINEVEGIQNRDGKVIRLLRSIATDEHESETALDDYVGFDCIVPKDVTIKEQNECTAKYLSNIGWIPHPISEYKSE